MIISSKRPHQKKYDSYHLTVALSSVSCHTLWFLSSSFSLRFFAKKSNTILKQIEAKADYFLQVSVELHKFVVVCKNTLKTFHNQHKLKKKVWVPGCESY